jgi:hypothetical protein
MRAARRFEFVCSAGRNGWMFLESLLKIVNEPAYRRLHPAVLIADIGFLLRVAHDIEDPGCLEVIRPDITLRLPARLEDAMPAEVLQDRLQRACAYRIGPS